MKLISIKPSINRNKKYTATFLLDNNKIKTVHFGGGEGARDYIYWNKNVIKSQADLIKKNYIARHIVREDWSNATSPGALSRWILWNKPTFKESYDDYVNKFDLL